MRGMLRARWRCRRRVPKAWHHLYRVQVQVWAESVNALGKSASVDTLHGLYNEKKCIQFSDDCAHTHTVLPLCLLLDTIPVITNFGTGKVIYGATTCCN